MIRLRAALPDDEWLAWELRRQIQPELTRATHLAWWKVAQEDRFIAYDGPVMVGILRVSPDGELHILVTEKERGKGLGTQMLEAIKSTARDLGYPRLWATVERDNPASHKAFLAAGYAPTRFEVAL
jgi:RimJ/RimL family protein N-acetyltransferase